MTAVVALDRSRALRAAAAFLVALLLTVGAVPAVEALGRLVPVIVVGPDAATAADLTRAQHGAVDAYLPIVDGVAGRVPESRLDELSARALVTPDRAMRLQSDSYGDSLVSAYPAEVGATHLWGEGVAGEGVTVAMVDTGVADVPDLRGRVIASANLTREAEEDDTYGHGTFQAGIIVGNGAASDGRYVGVAPEADLLSVKVADRTGATSLGQVLAGVQLVDSAAERFDVRVLLLAVDSESPLPPELDPLSTALRKVWSHGVVVVVPAGNDGPDAGTIASPGEDPYLLTAGSVDDQGTASVADDTVSDYSGRGPTRWGDEKPDLAAPGRSLVSLRALGSTVDRENSAARVEDAYFKGSGTSMAASVTAGAAALLLSARPELSPDQVKSLLMSTAIGIEGGEADSIGTGVVDAAAAVAYDEDLPEFPEAPDLGEAEEPFTPRGLDFGWAEGKDGRYRWVARQWRARQWNARQWTDEEWEELHATARQWAARQWTARQWTARQWAARQWAARQWAARQWTARQWAARQWAAGQWTARQWAARQWAARQWAARQWAARQWTSDDWAARQWAARQWAARQWTEEEWSARQWSARQWSARQWSQEQWEARQWSARQWSARQWSARQWSDDAWEARQWSARQWSARQWSARQWSTMQWE